jgi:hypothetical protein
MPLLAVSKARSTRPLDATFFSTLKWALTLLLLLSVEYGLLAQACPTLSQASTLTSNDCAPGTNPCTLCPGDVITLNTSGTGVQPGSCVNWYYGTSPNFNPYNGQGTLIGCSEIESAPISPCNACPTILALYVDACGTEANNEIIAMWSGSGFAVDGFTVDFNSITDVGGGSSCQWQEPSSNALSSIQSICPNATIVGAGPGETVPPNVPVIVFTSAGYNFNYNFGSLCPLSPVIYVLQNGCTLSTEAFPQTGGAITTTVGQDCGCDQTITYNTGSLSGGNGAFVVPPLLPFLPPIYGNVGCGFPPLGGGGGGGGANTIVIPPYNYTIPASMCNTGPFWVRGIVQPLPGGCPQTITNAMPFNVVCPEPVLQPGPTLCTYNSPISLNPLADPAVPNGTWSGPGVTGTTFNPANQSGEVVLTFTPTSACGIPANTTITVNDRPTALFEPTGSVCAGQSVPLVINLTGLAPFSFDLYAGNNFVQAVFTTDYQVTINVTPPANASSVTYRVLNLQDANCVGLNTSTTVFINEPTTAQLTMTTPSTICAGQTVTFSLDFLGAPTPYEFIPTINGVPQAPIFASDEPVFFSYPFNVNSTISVTQVTAQGCPVTVSGTPNITVTTAPVATLTTSTRTICEGILDTLRININNAAAGLNLQLTQNGSLLPAIMAQAPFTLLPVVPLIGTNIFRINALTGGVCPGTVSGVDTTFVIQRPNAALTGTNGSCANGPSQLTVNYTPVNAPTQIQYTANGIPQPTLNATSSPFSWPVNVANTTDFVLTSISSLGCTGTATGAVQLAPGAAPTATLTGGGQICLAGVGDSLTVTFTGTGPWTFVYSANDIDQPPITTTQNPYKIFVNPVGFTRYRLVSVSDPACPGTVSGLAEVFVFVSSSVTLAGDQTFCNVANLNLEPNVSGTAPFIVTYAINGVVQPADTIDEPPYLIPVNVTQTTVFSLVSIQSPGCIGNALGSATITVNPTPTATNITRTCNAAAGTYTVSFNVQNGTPPYTLTTGTGTFSGNTFTSAPILQSQNYNFVFNDINDCGDVTVSGPTTCNCVTNAGTLTAVPGTLCAGDTAKAVFNNNQLLDGSDALRFILFSNPAQPTTSILAWNSQPEFILGSLTPNQTYYIAAIAGNDAGNGQILLSDPCVSVSPPVPVIWRPNPTAIFVPASVSACVGDSLDIPIQLTGTAPFSLSYTINGVAQPPLPIASSGVFTLKWDPAPGQQTWVMTALSDLFCSNSALNDQIIVSETPLPIVNNITRTCDVAAGTYIVEFDLTGQAPYMVNGLNGSFNANGHFVSVPIASGTPYNATITDATNCGNIPITGIASCDCTTNAGTLSTTLQIFCDGQPASISPASGTTIPAGSGLVYLLTTAPMQANWTILAQSATPNFNFINGTTAAGITYYIVAAAATNLPTGGINFSDICLDYSNAAPITWRFPILAAISGGGSVCVGGNATFSIVFSGNAAPYTFVLSRNGVPQPPQTTSTTPFTFSVPVTSMTTYSLVSVASGNCTGAVFGTATANITPTPQAEGVSIQCDPANLNYTLSFRISNGAAPNQIYQVTGVIGNLTDTTFTSLPIPIGTPYTVTISGLNGCSSTFSGIGTCNCITDAGTLIQPQNGCTTDSVRTSVGVQPTLDPNDAIIYALCSNPAQIPGSIITINEDAPVFGFGTGLVTGQDYFIVALAGNTLTSGALDPTDPCLSVSQPVAVRFSEPPSAIFSIADTTVCAGTNLSLQIQCTGQAPFTIEYEVNGQGFPPITVGSAQFPISTVNLQTNEVFVLRAITDANCTVTLSDTARIQVLPRPIVRLTGGGSACPNQSVSITVELENATTADIEVAQTGANPLIFNDVADGFVFQVSPNISTSYNVISATVTGNDCPPQLSGVVQVNVQPITVTANVSNYNGFNVSCGGFSDGDIQPTVQGGAGNYTYVWSNGSTTAQNNTLTAGTYTLTVSDPTGCSAIEMVVLTEPEPIDFQLIATSPRCFGDQNGSITLDQLNGGAAPYRWQVGIRPSRSADNLPDVEIGLAADFYEVVVTDANGCSANRFVQVESPRPILVDLGPDQTISYGDSTEIWAQLSISDPASFVWSPAGALSRRDTLRTWTRPLSSTQYRLVVTDDVGCTASDELLIIVRNDSRIYVPNAITTDNPDNGVLTVFAGAEVQQIQWLRVYDRWGNQVFDNQNFAPNDPRSGWDGRINGQPAPPAVFVWMAAIEFVDGSVQIFKGDVSVVR